MPGTRMECVIESRKSGDCYTNEDAQKGTARGTKGGPLRIDVQAEDYILLRGFCLKNDRMCQPH